MTLTLQLDPDSLNNGTMAMFLQLMMESASDLNVVVTGDVFSSGTWFDFGDPAASSDSDYGMGLNNPDNGLGPLGTGQWQWMVVDHRVS